MGGQVLIFAHFFTFQKRNGFEMRFWLFSEYFPISKFEIFFTNSLGLPYNTGMWSYFILVAAALAWGIFYSSKKKLPNLQNAVYAVLVILIGYSSFAMIVVRSGANPPMDENNPENIVNLLPYLNREQYGDRPLFFGQSFSL